MSPHNQCFFLLIANNQYDVINMLLLIIDVSAKKDNHITNGRLTATVGDHQRTLDSDSK